MEVTPNDLRQQHFEIKFRGYNPDDVEVFRDFAANALEEAQAEILRLTAENKQLKARVEQLLSTKDHQIPDR
jgi:DivIVA domain-containing protein